MSRWRLRCIRGGKKRRATIGSELDLWVIGRVSTVHTTLLIPEQCIVCVAEYPFPTGPFSQGMGKLPILLSKVAYGVPKGEDFNMALGD